MAIWKPSLRQVVYSQSSQWDARSGRVWKGNGSASSVWGPTAPPAPRRAGSDGSDGLAMRKFWVLKA